VEALTAAVVLDPQHRAPARHAGHGASLLHATDKHLVLEEKTRGWVFNVTWTDEQGAEEVAFTILVLPELLYTVDGGLVLVRAHIHAVTWPDENIID